MIDLEYKLVSELTHHYRLGFTHCLMMKTHYHNGISIQKWYDDLQALEQHLKQTCGDEIENKNVWPLLADNEIYFRDKQLAMLVKLGWASR